MNAAPVIVIAAGGTGGHIFPALSVAAEMHERGWKVIWLGIRNSMEAKIVPEYGFPISFIRFAGVRGKGKMSWLKLPFTLSIGLLDSFKILRKQRPNVVLVMGGYIALPIGLMAFLSRCSFILHEQNSIAGWANRLLSYLAKPVFTAFPQTLKTGEWVGNPLAKAFQNNNDDIEQRYRNRSSSSFLRILIIGGSLGAAALNQIVAQAFAKLSEQLPLWVIHQTGEKHLEATIGHYQEVGLKADVCFQANDNHVYSKQFASKLSFDNQDLFFNLGQAANQNIIKVAPFIHDMADAYRSADLVICRSGAMTVSEIAAIGIASLLIPFPFAVDDHQTFNAQFLVAAGAAEIIQQRDLTVEKLVLWIKQHNRSSLLNMAKKARGLAKRNAHQVIADACIKTQGY